MSDLASVIGADRQRHWEGEPPPLVKLNLLYDAFAPSTCETHIMAWHEGVTLGEYMEGLPTEAEWMIFHNGQEVSLSDAHLRTVAKGDQLGLLVVPQGKNGIKSILKIVLMAAVIVVAAMSGQWWVIAAVAIGAGIINHFLLTPKPPKGNDKADERSYGIDGAKNSATEGIPYPVGYGEFRIAGNFSDCYTENVGDDQYLYLRTILNDGEIEGVSEVELNEQPLTNFTDVQLRVSNGALNNPVNDWFGRSVVQKNKSQKIETGFLYHVSTTAVDKIRFDVGFTQGLTSISEKKGTYSPRSVEFEFMYRALHPQTKQPIGNGAFQPLPMPGATTGRGWLNGSANFKNVLQGVFGVKAKAQQAMTTPATLEYRKEGTAQWITFGELGASEGDLRGYSMDPSSDGTIAGNTNITPYVTGTFQTPELDGGDYDFRVQNGEIERYEYVQSANGNRIVVTDQRTKQIRMSFESIQLPNGFYEFGIRRTTPTSTDKYEIDEVFLTDIAEIESDQVPLRGTANLSIRAKVNEQLNGIPNVSAKVRLSKLQEYDIDGNPTVKRWSGNHAWVVLDMMCGAERGAGLSLSRIDWPAWVDFAQYCTDNNLSFNGVFEERTNLGDAVNEVLRAAHAAPVPLGTKLSVVIDRPRKPVQAFTQANILKGTFSIDYMSMSERANDFSVSYFDKNDRNKQKTIRYVDPKAVTFNEMPRQASFTLRGCDNLAQAKRELWRMIYSNRLIIRSVNFETAIDSISMVRGEVALIQHDMMQWADSGRLKAASSNLVLNLDQPVTKDAGKNYRVLVHFDALQRGSRQINSVVGKKIFVTGASIQNLSVKRLMIGTQDLQVISMRDGAPYHTIQVAEAPIGNVGGQNATLWDTDVLEERDVVAVAQLPDGTSQVQISAALPAAPAELTNFVYGEVQNVKKPYVLVGVSGTGLEKRRLTFAEYHEGIYGPAEIDIPTPVTAVNDRQVSHVQALNFDFERLVEPGRLAINTRVHWNAADIRNYGGADVYMALNEGVLRPIGSAQNVSEYHLTLKPGDIAEFMVVAHNTRGDRAPAVNAPRIKGTLTVEQAELAPPTNLATTTQSFEIDGTVFATWGEPSDMDGVAAYEFQWRDIDDSFWQTSGIINALQYKVNALGLGTFEVRVRSVNGDAVSPWVSKTHDIAAPPMTGSVTGLKEGDGADTKFIGKDAHFSWTDGSRDKAYFLDYRVQIKTTGGTVLRTEYTTTPSYTYTHEKNAQDSVGQPNSARGTFQIEVRQRGRQGQLSNAAVLTVTNDPPVLGSAPSASGTAGGVIVGYTAPNVTDFAGAKIYMALTPNVALTVQNLRYIGPNNQVTLAALGSGMHYIKVVPYDTFGDGVVSAEVSAAPTTFTSAITLQVSNEEIGVPSAADGSAPDLTNAFGQVTVLEGSNEVTPAAVLSIPAGGETNCDGDINTATNVPVNGKPKGYYRVATMGGAGAADTAMMVVQAVYAGLTLQRNITLSKRRAGAAGATPASITLDATSPVFKFDGLGNVVAQTIVFTATRNATAIAQTQWVIRDSQGSNLASGNAAAIASTGYFTRLNDDAISMAAAQYVAFTAGSPQRDSFTVEVLNSGAVDRTGITRVQNGATAKSLYVYSDKSNVNYGADGNIANPSQQTVTFTIQPQNLPAGVAYTISLFRSDGVQLNANSYLGASPYTQVGNSFTTTSTTFTMQAAHFDAATNGGYQGVYAQVTADGVSDRQSVTKTKDGVAGAKGDKGDKGVDGSSAFTILTGSAFTRAGNTFTFTGNDTIRSNEKAPQARASMVIAGNVGTFQAIGLYDPLDGVGYEVGVVPGWRAPELSAHWFGQNQFGIGVAAVVGMMLEIAHIGTEIRMFVDGVDRGVLRTNLPADRPLQLMMRADAGIVMNSVTFRAAGTPGASAFTLVNVNNSIIKTGNSVEFRPTGSWNARVMTLEAGLACSIEVNHPTVGIMVGLTTDPTNVGGDGYSTIDYALHHSSDNQWLGAYENSGGRTQYFGGLPVASKLRVTCDGQYVRYWADATLLGSTLVKEPGKPLYGVIADHQARTVGGIKFTLDQPVTTAFTMVNQMNVASASPTAWKKVGGSGWDGFAYSKESGPAMEVVCDRPTAGSHFIALDAEPTSVSNWPHLDYGFNFSTTDAYAYKKGGGAGWNGSIAQFTRLVIATDGTFVYWYGENASGRKLLHQIPLDSGDVGRPFHAMAAIHDQFTTLNGIGVTKIGTAGSAPVTLIPHGHISSLQLTPNSVRRPAELGNGDWNAGVYGVEGYTQGCLLTHSPMEAGTYKMFGINTDPVTDASYGSIDWCYYHHGDGNTYVWREGFGTVDNCGATNPNSTYAIRHDATQNKIYFLVNGVARPYVADVAAGSRWFLDSSIITGGCKNISFIGTGSSGAVGTPGAPARSIKIVASRSQISTNHLFALDPAGQATEFKLQRQNTSAGVVWTITDDVGNGHGLGNFDNQGNGDIQNMPGQNALNVARYPVAAGQRTDARVVKVTATVVEGGQTLTDTVTLTIVPAGAPGQNGSGGGGYPPKTISYGTFVHPSEILLAPGAGISVTAKLRTNVPTSGSGGTVTIQLQYAPVGGGYQVMANGEASAIFLVNEEAAYIDMAGSFSNGTGANQVYTVRAVVTRSSGLANTIPAETYFKPG